MALANQTGLSEKYVSERHFIASQTKLTAGESAKKLKKSGFSISAKELVNAFTLLKGYEPEWHHSGFYSKGSGKKIMGRTFFFTEDQLNEIFLNKEVIFEKQKLLDEEFQKAKETIVCGFYYIWESSGTGRYKKKFKRLQWYKGSKVTIPANFESCTEDFYQKNKSKTTAYYGWDCPNLDNI